MLPIATPTYRRPSRDSAEPGDRAPCGWFDSSHELNRGLQVRVHEAPDTLVPLLPSLPLGWWLQWELDASLSSQRPARAA